MTAPNTNEIIHLYTDGGCSCNPGPGGYGVVILEKGIKRELSGGFVCTTNNRMEIYAAIKGLESIPDGIPVMLHSDSKYLIDAIDKKWIAGWKRRGWKRSAGELQNADLWKKMDELLFKHPLKTTWVRGHNGHLENERCDVLAVAALKKPNLPEDVGYATVGTIQATKAAPISKIPNTFVPTKDKVDAEGQSCRKCGAIVEKRMSKKKEKKPGQFYYYEWYLACPNCHTNYMVESAKRFY